MIEAIGRYKVQDQIGTGAMGDVYRARDLQHGRLVAIKVLPAAIAEDATRRGKFLSAARAAAAISHPNIAALTEAGDDPDQLFLVFDFVSGETLRKTIGGRPFNPRQAIELAAEIADALGEWHAVGVVHGDLSSANVLVTPTGHAKVLDFGLSAWTRGAAGRAAADESADILSLGKVLFEMLTGNLPPDRAPAPSTVHRSLPVELDLIVLKALARDADQRYASALTLAAELRAVGAVLDVRSDASHPSIRPATSSYAKWIAAAAIVAAGAIAWLTLRRRESRPAAGRMTSGP